MRMRTLPRVKVCCIGSIAEARALFAKMVGLSEMTGRRLVTSVDL